MAITSKKSAVSSKRSLPYAPENAKLSKADFVEKRSKEKARQSKIDKYEEEIDEKSEGKPTAFAVMKHVYRTDKKTKKSVKTNQKKSIRVFDTKEEAENFINSHADKKELSIKAS